MVENAETRCFGKRNITDKGAQGFWRLCKRSVRTKELQVDHEVPSSEVVGCPRHRELNLNIVGLLRHKYGVVKRCYSERTHSLAILQVDIFLKIDGRNVLVVKEQVRCGGNCEKSRGYQEEENGGEIGLDGGR